MAKVYDFSRPLTNAAIAEICLPFAAGLTRKLRVFAAEYRWSRAGPGYYEPFQGLRHWLVVDSVARHSLIDVRASATKEMCIFRFQGIGTIEDFLSVVSGVDKEVLSIPGNRSFVEIDNLRILSESLSNIEFSRERARYEEDEKAGGPAFSPSRSAVDASHYHSLRNICRELKDSIGDIGLLYRSAWIARAFISDHWHLQVFGFMLPDTREDIANELKVRLRTKGVNTRGLDLTKLVPALAAVRDDLINKAPDFSKSEFAAWFRTYFLPEEATASDMETAHAMQSWKNRTKTLFYTRLAIVTAALDGFQRLLGPHFKQVMPARYPINQIRRQVGLNLR